MTPDQIAAWAAAGESATLELKKSTAEIERACRTLCAFANGQGGRVLIGVTPVGKVVGQTVSDHTLEELAQEFRGFEPPVFPTVERVVIANGLEVLVLTVGCSVRAPVTFRGVPYERVLNTTHVMPRETFHRLLLEEMHATRRWENEPAQGWEVAQLDRREMLLTLEEAIRRGRVDDPGTREPLEVLRGLGLLVDGDRLSRAAVVLFCTDDVPLPDYPQLLLKVARFRGTTRDEFLDNRQFYGNAFSLMRRAERFLLDWLPVAGRIVPGRMEREDTPLLPIEALREALANAFVHRDYAVGGGSVNVALYDDRLEIISIGDLHFGLTPEALFREHESRPWNPMIARTFYRRGIIETWGRGTLKIARLMRERELEPPRVTLRSGAVVVTFDIAAALAAMRRQAGADEPSSRHQVGTKSALSAHQVEVLELATVPRSLVELMAPTGRTDRTKFRDQVLRPLVTAGWLELTIPEKPRSSKQRYRLTGLGRRTLAESGGDESTGDR